ncbi:hypothetical protein F5Y04DRAFT_275006 [Hypomontagnella monticulosa]|nr:hypothetical protein F5Y04DRAFT_275006 [Hypomontagnella monticulosa]
MKLFTAKGSASLLALLLSLLSTFTFCYADLSSGDHDANSTSILQSRKMFPELAEFNRKMANAQRHIFTNEQGYMDFKSAGEKSFATDGFDGCIGLAVASKKGALIGHYTMTDWGLNQLMTNFKSLYETHKEDLQKGKAWVYVNVHARNEEQFVEEQMAPLFIDGLRSITGMEPQIKKYIVAVDWWYDANAEPIYGEPDVDNMRSGGFLIENPGGGSSNSKLIYASIRMIKKSGEPIDL